VSARLNVLSALLTFLAALSLFARKPETAPIFLVDDLNIVFIVLNTFVAFTTSCSARATSPTNSRPDV